MPVQCRWQGRYKFTSNEIKFTSKLHWSREEVGVYISLHVLRSSCFSIQYSPALLPFTQRTP
jgi:hypothetical protein